MNAQDPKEIVPPPFVLLSSDAVLQEAQRESFSLARHPAIDDWVRSVFAEPDLAFLAPKQGELDPMFYHPGGGVRIPVTYLLSSLFSCALQFMYFLRLPKDEETFVRTVIEGFEEFRRAARGESIHAHSVIGFAHVTLRKKHKLQRRGVCSFHHHRSLENKHFHRSICRKPLACLQSRNSFR